MKRKLPEHIVSKFPKELIFDFSDDKKYGGFFVVGYPHWDAFVSAAGSDFWIGITPEIDVNKKTVVLPEERKKGRKSDRYKEIESLFKPFFNSIPEKVIRLAGRYNDSHWEIIKAIILLGEDFERLIETNSAMAYLIITLNEINPTFQLYNETELLKKLIKTKQKEILRFAFFPATENIRRILGKIKPDLISRENFILFNRFIVSVRNESKEIFKLLNHIDSINKNLMKLLSYYPKLSIELPNELISELIEENEFDKIIAILERIRKRSAGVNIPFPKISSVSEINRIDKVNLERVKEKRKRLESFPAPPIPGNDIIEPLENIKTQISWSKKQNNCIRNFTASVKRKRSYFYKINYKGEEATLEIKRRNGGCALGDLLGKGNVKVSRGLRAYVNAWFKNSQKND